MLLQRVAQGGQLLERDAQGDQVARVAAALDQPRDEPLHIAHLAQAFLQGVALGLIRLRPGDHALAALDGGQIAQRREQPLAQKPSAARSDGPVDRGEQRRLARAGAEGIDQLQIAARGGVENEDILALPEPQRVDMAERPAQFVAEIMEQAARRAERAAGGVLLAGRGNQAEAIERRGLEVIAQRVLGRVGRETPGVVLDEKIRQPLAVGERGGFQIDAVSLGHDDLRRAQSRRAHRAALPAVGKSPAKNSPVVRSSAATPKPSASGAIGGEKVVLLRLELAGIEDAARREDLRDLAPHDLPGPRRFHLVANGHAPARLEQLRDVALRRVVGHAAHRRSLALGERQVEQPRALLGIAEKHLVEIAQPEKQHGVGRDFALEPMILLHHGGEDVGHGARR